MIGALDCVGMGEAKFGDTDRVLAVYGLGSCIALALYDPDRQHGVMSHIVLPDSGGNGAGGLRYADLAVRASVDMLRERGSRPRNLRAKITGGANLFPTASGVPFMEIGPKNVQAVKRLLSEESIALIAADVGGNKGRTVMFYPGEGRLEVRRTGEQAFSL